MRCAFSGPDKIARGARNMFGLAAHVTEDRWLTMIRHQKPSLDGEETVAPFQNHMWMTFVGLAEEGPVSKHHAGDLEKKKTGTFAG
jgi:hypothetical protein